MYNKKLNSIKTKRPSSDLSVALDVFMSSLKCEMAHRKGGGFIKCDMDLDSE